MSDQTPPHEIGLAVAKLSEITAVGLAELKGQMALLLQRADHADWRVDQLAQRVDLDRAALEARIAALETRLDVLDARLDSVERVGVTREDLASRFRQTLGLLTLIVAVLAIGVTVLLAVIR